MIGDCPYDSVNNYYYPFQDEVNSFYNKRLMENITHLKITFVATMSSLKENHGLMFIYSINNFSKMFKDVSFL
jgi:hypothetical protein